MNVYGWSRQPEGGRAEFAGPGLRVDVLCNGHEGHHGKEQWGQSHAHRYLLRKW